MQYTRLFTPIVINGMPVKNRIVQAPVHMVYSEDGSVNERVTKYYLRRAEGGVGLIIIGGCSFDDYGFSTSMLSLRDDSTIPGWKAFTGALHKTVPDVKLAVQLYHAGRYAKQKNIGAEALAPSAVYSTYSRETPRAMTHDDIETVRRKWAEGAVRAKTAGFDAVEILGSAGYLISQFLSPITNQRDDEYGGSWENRCRFPLEVIRAVRGAVGPDFPVLIRIAGNDFMPGGNTGEDTARFATLAEEAGVDAINVTGGWHESVVPQITADLPRGGFSYLAAEVKAVVSIPVMSSNRNSDPDTAEEILALGRADMICLGRPLITDPDWPAKAQAGVPEEIRRCLGCNQGCLAKTFFGNPVECLVNGRAGREYLLGSSRPAPKVKNILVVGAGPAGCEFAVEAAKRGHHLTVWEKTGDLGGQIPLAAAPVPKQEFLTLVDYYRVMLGKLGIIVRFNHAASVETILASNFDEVVVATGSMQRELPLHDTCGVTVMYADDVLSHARIPGKNVVIIGGGAVGCEVAQYLADRGTLSGGLLKFLMTQQAEPVETIQRLLNTSDRNVVIVEMLKKIGNGFDPGCAGPVLRDLKRLAVKNYTLAQVKTLTDTGLVLIQEREDGPAEVTLSCDTVVIAAGRVPQNALYKQLKERGVSVHCLGDAAKVGKVLDAIKGAVDLSAAI